MLYEAVSESVAPGETPNRTWPILAGVAVTAILLLVSLRSIDWASVWSTVTRARWPYLAFSAALGALAYLQRALRWRVLLRAEAEVSARAVFAANMAGYLGNMLLPARAGEIVRSMLIGSRPGVSSVFVLATALTERAMDVIALALWSAAAILLIRETPAWMSRAAWAMASLAGAGILAVIVAPRTGGRIEVWMRTARLPGRFRTRAIALGRQAVLGVSSLHNVRRLAGFTLFTAAIWLSDILATIMGAKALGLSVSFAAAVLLITGLGLGSILPLTPGNLGLYPFVAVSILPLFGVSRDGALAFGLVAQLMAYLVIAGLAVPAMCVVERSGVRSALAVFSKNRPVQTAGGAR